MSTPSTLSSSDAPRPAPVSSTRRLLVAAAVGALLLAGALTLTTGRPGLGVERTVAGPVVPTGSVPTTGALSGTAFGTATPGTCLTWSDPDFRDLSQTPCTEEHLFEVADVVDLSRYPGAELGPDAPFPGVLRFTQLRDEVCRPAVESYLDGRFDPYGLFSVGLVNPGAQAWAAGERTLRCGLQQASRTGALSPVVGRVADLDQSDVTAVGTCSGIEATLPTDPVDCREPHASETIAVVDLAPQLPAGPPSDTDQDAVLEGACTQAADAWTGAPGGAAAKQLTVFWDDVRPESWLAGSTRVNCYLGQALPEGGFAAVTGSARGEAVPAPATTTTAPAAPGASPQVTPGATATTTAPAPSTTPAAPAPTTTSAGA